MREKQVAGLSDAIAALNLHVNHLAHIAHERAIALDEARERIDRRGAELSARITDLSSRVARLQAELAAERSAAGKAQADLYAERSGAAHLESELAAARVEAARAQLEVLAERAASGEAAALRVRAANLEEALRAANRRADDAAGVLSGMIASRSWRMTKPLRVVARSLRSGEE